MTPAGRRALQDEAQRDDCCPAPRRLPCSHDPVAHAARCPDASRTNTLPLWLGAGRVADRSPRPLADTLDVLFLAARVHLEAPMRRPLHTFASVSLAVPLPPLGYTVNDLSTGLTELPQHWWSSGAALSVIASGAAVLGDVLPTCGTRLSVCATRKCAQWRSWRPDCDSRMRGGCREWWRRSWGPPTPGRWPRH